MSMYDNLYCKIFIDTDEEREKVLNSIKDIVSGAIERWTIISESMEIELRKNEEFNKREISRKEDGFFYSRYYLDIEPKENIEQEEYIFGIAILLENLWSIGYKAVASCDFENELPRKGGYRCEQR
ncbi:hypothetical protein CDLVIII_3208 [Clostridium sp. DL-VIII]|uniref:1,4-dihydroxy-6-naphthoate synthase n=1 Tax=Clostridium sp. DL-VIII TaxID=641107 RepID=UPI00023AFFD5|nr:1,4-dihydroxy-6-naphthoate synthase [Clostridium sp. DL-VIII]EHI99782.1 hypothetical protein CDLVIII_3208 [Clostridium sp. DL-VIII]